MEPGRRPIARAAAALVGGVALVVGAATAHADRPGSPVETSPLHAAGAPLAGDESAGPPVPTPTAGQRGRADVPVQSVGSSRVGIRAANGVRSTVIVDDAGALHAALATGVTPVEVWEGGLFGFVANLDAAQIARLRATAGVLSVEADAPVRIAAQQADPPWGLDRIDQRSLPVDSSYTYTQTGAGVTAYVIDSGIWASHTEFAGRIPYGYYWDFGDGSEIWDCNGHGTHVAGTLGGTTYGVAKEVTIVPVKVLDCDGNGSSWSVLAGIDAVIDDHPAGVPAVANMSLGGPASAAMDAAVEAMIADGITVVVAAGNDSIDACTQSPGRLPEVITVAASTTADDDAWFSNFGACNDLFAPGVSVRSAWPGATDTAWNVMSGTSMASPHVAGVAALVLESAPASTPGDVWATIDGAATTGALSECCGDPDKLLFVPPPPAPLVTPPAEPPATTDAPTTAPAPPDAPPPTITPAPQPVDADLVTVQPARLYDSRTGPGARPAGSVTEVQVGGRAGVPADGALAALNVTAVEPGEAGYLTAFPCGTAVPDASNVNYRGGQTIPNAVVVRIGDGGRVCVYTSATTGLLVDVNGYAPSTTRLAALHPRRLYDSRTTGAPRAAGSITEVQVAGAGGVGSDATTALLNVTAVDALGDGYMTVFPCGTAPPEASNLNFRTGQTIANAVLARTGPGGRVCVYTSAPAGLLVDVNAAAPPAASVVAIEPRRLLDTRQRAGPAAAQSITVVQVAGAGGVPASARTAVLNVTALDAAAGGYVTAFPCGMPVPDASNLNVDAGQTIPNAVIAKLGVDGTACLFTSVAAGLLVDVDGYTT